MSNALKREDAAKNGSDRLDEAMAMLIQNQASFLSHSAETDRRLSETERTTSERFARIERDMSAILHVLSDHSRLLERLPDAVRDKIRFKGQPEAER